jgi:hypothetical protein
MFVLIFFHLIFHGGKSSFSRGTGWRAIASRALYSYVYFFSQTQQVIPFVATIFCHQLYYALVTNVREGEVGGKHSFSH